MKDSFLIAAAVQASEGDILRLLRAEASRAHVPLGRLESLVQQLTHCIDAHKPWTHVVVGVPVGCGVVQALAASLQRNFYTKIRSLCFWSADLGDAGCASLVCRHCMRLTCSQPFSPSPSVMSCDFCRRFEHWSSLIVVLQWRAVALYRRRCRIGRVQASHRFCLITTPLEPAVLRCSSKASCAIRRSMFSVSRSVIFLVLRAHISVSFSPPQNAEFGNFATIIAVYEMN